MPTDVTQLVTNSDGPITERNNCREACLASYEEDLCAQTCPVDATYLASDHLSTEHRFPRIRGDQTKRIYLNRHSRGQS